MRNSLTSKAVLMYFATIFAKFSSVIKISNFSISLSESKSTMVLVASDNKAFLCRENVRQ